MIQLRKIRLFIYSPYKQLLIEGFSFIFESNKYKIELTGDSKSIKNSLHWRRKQFNLKALYRDLNAYFIQYNI